MRKPTGPYRAYVDTSNIVFAELEPFTQPGVVWRERGDGLFSDESPSQKASYYVNRGMLKFLKWDGPYTIEEDPC